MADDNDNDNGPVDIHGPVADDPPTDVVDVEGIVKSYFPGVTATFFPEDNTWVIG